MSELLSWYVVGLLLFVASAAGAQTALLIDAVRVVFHQSSITELAHLHQWLQWLILGGLALGWIGLLIHFRATPPSI